MVCVYAHKFVFTFCLTQCKTRGHYFCLGNLGHGLLTTGRTGQEHLRVISVFSSVQSLSHVRLFVTPWTAAQQASLAITNSQSSLLSAIRVVSYAYLRLFLLAILIPACASSSPAFLMRYFAYQLNKHGDNIQPQHTPFLIWNQSVVPCSVLSVAS